MASEWKRAQAPLSGFPRLSAPGKQVAFCSQRARVMWRIRYNICATLGHGGGYCATLFTAGQHFIAMICTSPEGYQQRLPPTLNLGPCFSIWPCDLFPKLCNAWIEFLSHGEDAQDLVSVSGSVIPHDDGAADGHPASRRSRGFSYSSRAKRFEH